MRNWKTFAPGMTMREYVAGDQRANMQKGDKVIFWMSGMVFEAEVLWIGASDSYFRNKEAAREAGSRQSSHWISSSHSASLSKGNWSRAAKNTWFPSPRSQRVSSGYRGTLGDGCSRWRGSTDHDSALRSSEMRRRYRVLQMILQGNMARDKRKSQKYKFQWLGQEGGRLEWTDEGSEMKSWTHAEAVHSSPRSDPSQLFLPKDLRLSSTAAFTLIEEKCESRNLVVLINHTTFFHVSVTSLTHYESQPMITVSVQIFWHQSSATRACV